MDQLTYPAGLLVGVVLPWPLALAGYPATALVLALAGLALAHLPTEED